MNAVSLRTAVALLAVAALAGPGFSQQGFEPLAGRDQVREIEGQRVTFPILPELRIVTEGGVNKVDLRVTIRLSDLQAKAPDILRAAVVKKSNDTVEFSLPEIAAQFLAGTLKLRGKLEASNDDLLIKITETAAFVLSLAPQFDANSVSVQGTLEEFDLGGGLLARIGADDLLKGLIKDAIEKGINDDDALFRMPSDLAEFGFKITEVTLNDAGDLSATASTELDGAGLTKLLSMIASRFQKE